MKRKKARGAKSFDRISKTALANVTGIARESAAKYLTAANAPKPDSSGLFDPALAAFHCGVCHGRATDTDRVVKMRERKAELELAKLERAEAIAGKEVVTAAEIAPTIRMFTAALTHHLRDRFEFSLPQRYEGRTLIERQLMNIDAIDSVLLELKKGTWELPGCKPAVEEAHTPSSPASVDTRAER